MSAEFPIFEALADALFLDLEISGGVEIVSAGVLGRDWQEEARHGRVHQLLQRLGNRFGAASVLCGHNTLDHDLKYLRERYPALRGLQDTPGGGVVAVFVAGRIAIIREVREV